MRKKPRPEEAAAPSVPTPSDPLAAVRGWFSSRGWTPFEFQFETWRAYAAGESGLIHAATGTGKTLAAWLGPVMEFMGEAAGSQAGRVWPPLRVLWITPLKALAADTAQSLLEAVRGLGVPWTVETRTGDTSSSVKARQRDRLPTALVTTPESLSVLLSRPDSRRLFDDLRCVVVDEWHELLSGKRGVQAELCLARLRRWRPALRTWGLSATLGNIEEALAALLGNAEVRMMNEESASPSDSSFITLPSAFPGRLIRGEAGKRIEIESLIPEVIERFPWSGHLRSPLLPRVVERIAAVRSSLVFCNTRAQAEIWYQSILDLRPDWAGLIALHHGSLDRKAREFVEGGLKDGRLRCVVCTSSLDLGVDFSPVDAVVQIGSPKGVARLLQRAGRSGHRPGAESRVLCVPTNTLELIDMAAARDAAGRGEIEGRHPLDRPLDVLAQHVVTLAAGGGFDRDELLAEVRTARAYRGLTDDEWEWVLDFAVRGGDALRAYPEFHRVVPALDGHPAPLAPVLGGEGSGVRGNEAAEGSQLPSQACEATRGSMTPPPSTGARGTTDVARRYVIRDERTARLHRLAIGTITSDAVMNVQFLRGGRLGTVEETFIARLRPGDVFLFSGRMLELVQVRDLTAYVRRTDKPAGTVPRWQGTRVPLSTELAASVRRRLEEARTGVFAGPEMAAVRPVLELQQKWSDLPAPDELLIERLSSREGRHLYLYPFEGRLVHEGLAALMAARMSRLRPITFTLAVNDYGIEMLSPEPAPLEDALREGLLRADNLADDIAAGLNMAELSKRQFREIARIAGLVTPGYPGAKSRKSGKHIQATAALFYDAFTEYDPGNLLLHQARREVLERQLEQSRLLAVLDRLSRARVVIRELRRPTPFAFPLMVDRLRDKVSSEKLSDRVKRMQVALEAAAG